MFSASDLITGISAVVIAVTSQRRVYAFVVGTFELIRGTVSILRKG
jgi:hypothetical protein